MGKNSLLKPTTEEKKKPPKGKAASSKKAASKDTKKTAAKKSATKKTVAKKSTSKKTTAKKSVAKKTAAKKSTPKKRVKKPTLKELLLKRFESPQPEKPYTPPAPIREKISVTPFLKDLPDEEEKRIRSLLLKKIDLSDIPEKKAPVEVETETVLKDAEEIKPKDETPEKRPTEETEVSAKKPDADVSTEPEEIKPEVKVVSSEPEKFEAKPDDSLKKTLIVAGACFAALILLLVGVSFKNAGSFHLRQTKEGLEIIKGRFAPMGSDRMLLLPGVKNIKIEDKIYKKSEVFPIIFAYYLDKADTFLKRGDLPDLGRIRSYLDEASKYATTDALRSEIIRRTAFIDTMLLIYRADLLAGKKTGQEIKKALDLLKEAESMAMDPDQLRMIKAKAERYTLLFEKIKKAPTGTL